MTPMSVRLKTIRLWSAFILLTLAAAKLRRDAGDRCQHPCAQIIYSLAPGAAFGSGAAPGRKAEA